MQILEVQLVFDFCSINITFNLQSKLLFLLLILHIYSWNNHTCYNYHPIVILSLYHKKQLHNYDVNSTIIGSLPIFLQFV